MMAPMAKVATSYARYAGHFPHCLTFLIPFGKGGTGERGKRINSNEERRKRYTHTRAVSIFPDLVREVYKVLPLR